MNTIACPVCGGGTVRNGRTAAGAQRWLCRACGATTTHRIDNSAKLLSTFLDWLFSSNTQDGVRGMSARTFRRKCARFWRVWPLPRPTGEVHRVVFVDGIRIARNVCVLIASTERHVIGWYLARSENSRAWKALMAPIPPPDMVVTDGGTGFEKARRQLWPDTAVQRCLFHVLLQVRRQTTSRPNLQAGAELYALAKALPRVDSVEGALGWLGSYDDWRRRWEGLLSERTLDPRTDRRRWTHERLVTARNGLDALIRRGHLFTFLDPALTADGPLPSTNNRLEGGVNSPLRGMLWTHRGMSTLRRVKAVFWWCYTHSEDPLPAAEILRVMPTDDDIAELYRRAARDPQQRDGPARWGDGLVWADLHHTTPWRTDWD